MDIIVPTGLDFLAVGGRSARKWADCRVQVGLYESVVEPHVTNLVTPLFGISQDVAELPPLAQQRPITYVIDNDSSWIETTSELNVRVKPPSSRKSFEAAKRAGIIALNPLLNCKMFASATPRILSATSVQNSFLTYDYQKIGGQRPGVCQAGWTAFSELELDSFASGVRVNRKRYNGAKVSPVSEAELERITLMLKGRLDAIAPDRSLVTQVVSEANSATWDIATEIGELPETIKYIMNGLYKGISLLTRAKREMRKSISSGSAIDDVASIWMQYRYAISPIIYSINDALDVLGMDAVKFQSFRGRKDRPLFDGETEFAGYSIKSPVNYNGRVFLKYKYDVDSKIHQGLKINLAATAWELLPLSFVFDWFFQVGDYLTAAFRPGVVTAYGCQHSVRCNGQLVLEGNSSETIKIDIDYYRCRPINPNAFIGINSDVFISFKRAMDAIALSWLIFGRKHRG